MAQKHYELPPLSALAAFEAAARHQSFKNAAAEMNVTPGAISHQVKALEADIGAPLFNRVHRGVALTQRGEMLFGVLRRSLLDVSTTMRQLRRTDEDRSVTIAATTAISSLWLTPRLTAFWKEHGTIPVDQLISDRPAAMDGTVDFRIVYGVMGQGQPNRYPLFRDHLIPVCSPAFASRNNAAELRDLAALPLVHLDAPDSGWTDWRKWFNGQGYHGDIASGIRVNNYTIALQAARDDAGLVLGWERLVQPLIDRGLLVTFGGFSLDAPGTFFIEAQSPDTMTDQAKSVLDWLVKVV